MTLIVAINGRESIWMMADTRLSSGNSSKDENGRKIMLLDTTDGIAILGYAGLGATIQRTQPADWMGRVLRGRSLPLELSLSVLAEVMKDELPRHLMQFPKHMQPAHYVVVPAFVGDELRLYSIDIVMSQDRKKH